MHSQSDSRVETLKVTEAGAIQMSKWALILSASLAYCWWKSSMIVRRIAAQPPLLGDIMSSQRTRYIVKICNSMHAMTQRGLGGIKLYKTLGIDGITTMLLPP